MDQNHNNQSQNQQIAGAITYPARTEQNAQPVTVQPRQPRNLQGLLRFAMEATKAEDAPGNSEFGPMDEERRKFLEEALKSLTVNVAEVLQKAIKTLTDIEKMKSIQLGQAVPEDVQTAFSNILEFIDDIDTANDFYKMGGFAIFPITFGSENDEVRAQACTVLAEACQNNPFCQLRALECGLLSILLNLVQLEKGITLSRCLYAISCCTREYEPACNELVSSGGCETLVHLLATCDHPQAKTKAAFLIRYLATHHADAKEQFIKLNLVQTIADQLKLGRDETTEHLLNTLLSLSEGQDAILLRQLTDPRVGLLNLLEEHLKHPDLVGDRFREEREYCQELISLLPKCAPAAVAVDDVVADR